MLKYKRPVAKLSLATRQTPRYTIEKGDEGWFYYNDLAEMVTSGAIQCSVIPDHRYPEWDEPQSHFCVIDNGSLKGLILRPIPARPNMDRLPGDGFEAGTGEEWIESVADDGLATQHTQTKIWQPAPGGTGYGPIKEDPNNPGQYLQGSWAFFKTSSTNGWSPNPWFRIDLKHAAPLEELITFTKDEAEATGGNAERPHYCIGFGADVLSDIMTPVPPPFAGLRHEWALMIPLVGNPYLYKNVVDQPDWYADDWPRGLMPLPWTGGSLSEVTPQKLAEGFTYRIGVIGNSICVWEGDGSFESEGFAYYTVRDRSQPVVGSGEIWVWGWPGQLTVTPMSYMFEAGSLWHEPFRVGTNAGNRYWKVWGQTPGAGSGCINGGIYVDVHDSTMGWDRYQQYEIEMYPYEYPEEPAADDEVTYTTPFVEGVSLWRTPDLTDNGPLAFYEIESTYQITMAAQLAQQTTQYYQVEVDNRMAIGDPDETGLSPTRTWTIGKGVKIEGGWICDVDGEEIEYSVDLGEYIVVDAQRNSQVGVFSVTDLLGRLALAQWDGGPLTLRGFNVAEAIRFLLACYAIGPDQYDIEDTGAALLPSTNLKNVNWSWPAGTSILEIVREIAEFGGRNAALWYDGTDHKIKTGCRYCRTKRTAANWYMHQDNGWSSSGCLAADIARTGNPSGVDLAIIASEADASDISSIWIATSLEVSVEALRPRSYANRITVVGETTEGRKIATNYRNDAALYALEDGSYDPYYIGFPITHVENVPNLKTTDAVNRRLVELAHEMCTFPIYITATIPLCTSLKPGMVVVIQGGRWAHINGDFFRVTEVRHDFKGPQTIIRGHQTWDYVAEVSSMSSSSSSSS